MEDRVKGLRDHSVASKIEASMTRIMKALDNNLQFCNKLSFTTNQSFDDFKRK
jgi:hypothetical protein